ncbi:MAG TPA: hypothetical protein ENH99_00955 [Candidatus Pacearchaeota archaeon]|nr:hypothetical protein [Candidatus Pacearchaeota archaeon]
MVYCAICDRMIDLDYDEHYEHFGEEMTKICKNPICGHSISNHRSRENPECLVEGCPCKKFEAEEVKHLFNKDGECSCGYHAREHEEMYP